MDHMVVAFMMNIQSMDIGFATSRNLMVVVASQMKVASELGLEQLHWLP